MLYYWWQEILRSETILRTYTVRYGFARIKDTLDLQGGSKRLPPPLKGDCEHSLDVYL